MNSNIATQDESLATNAKLHREGILTHAIQSQSSSSEPSESCTDGISFVSEVEIPLAEGEDAERERYALLTIGDGLVAQIPALVLSTAAAIMVTRNNDAEMMGEQVMRQMFSTPRAIGIAAGILFVMGIVPGMPHVAFLSLSFLAAAGAMYIYYYGFAKKTSSESESTTVEDDTDENPTDPEELGWHDVTPVDAIGLEVGYRLIPLVDKTQGGELLARIKGIRKKLSQELGFLIPSVHIRDNLDLAPNEYKISLLGVVVGSADVFPERDMAINPGQVYGKLQGIETKDPAFGLEALWIEKSQKEQAESLGYTVVDSATVVATHLNHILQNHAHEILGHEEVQQLLTLLAQHSPKLAEELPEIVNTNIVLKVLQNLLSEQVPIRDMRTIAETLAAHGGKSQDSVALTAAVRMALNRVIAQSIYGDRAELPVITLDTDLEQILLKSLQQSALSGAEQEDNMTIEPKLAESLQRSLVDTAQKQEVAGDPAVLLVAAPLRPMLSRFARYTIEGLKVLSYQEIPDNKQVTIVASVGG